jgi:hypothetical protein
VERRWSKEASSPLFPQSTFPQFPNNGTQINVAISDVALSDTHHGSEVAFTLKTTILNQGVTAMQFSIIYSVDCPSSEDISDFAPPNLELWDQTEGDEQYEYDYLEGEWEDGFHRKWAAILDRDQFDDFINSCHLQAEHTETMGSLGAPGCGYGWAPAISFNSCDPDALLSAYVTPLPEISKDIFDDDDWNRVRGAVLAVYA